MKHSMQHRVEGTGHSRWRREREEAESKLTDNSIEVWAVERAPLLQRLEAKHDVGRGALAVGYVESMDDLWRP